MNKEQAKQLLPIIQAYADGAVIQYRSKPSDPWGDYSDISFTHEPECYRIKPKEPREWRGRVIGTGRHYEDGTRHFDIEMEDAKGELPEVGEMITLREIL